MLGANLNKELCGGQLSFLLRTSVEIIRLIVSGGLRWQGEEHAVVDWLELWRMHAPLDDVADDVAN